MKIFDKHGYAKNDSVDDNYINGKKVFKRIAICDLRPINSVESANGIALLSDIAVLIIPKDGNADVLSAIATIPKHNIAVTIALGVNDEIINGERNLFFEDIYDKDIAYVINGSCCILAKDSILIPPTDNIPTISINGELYISDSLKKYVDIASTNGVVNSGDYNYIKTLNNVTIIPSLIEGIRNKTLIIIERKVRFDKSVTVEMLKSKNLLFELSSFSKFRASKDVKSYIMMSRINN